MQKWQPMSTGKQLSYYELLSNAGSLFVSVLYDASDMLHASLCEAGGEFCNTLKNMLHTYMITKLLSGKSKGKGKKGDKGEATTTKEEEEDRDGEKLLSSFISGH